MGRPSLRNQRRVEVARAFGRVLGAHGQGGATIAAIAAEAGVAPGLVHHYFESKDDLYEALLEQLVADFHRRVQNYPAGDPLDAYVGAALSLDERSDVSAARAWVGVFAEALAAPGLFAKVRRVIDAEVAHVERRSQGALSAVDASAVVAFVVGALVFGGATAIH
jgi:TetR/AcrR family transcriptional repressor of bet genes